MHKFTFRTKGLLIAKMTRSAHFTSRDVLDDEAGNGTNARVT